MCEDMTGYAQYRARFLADASVLDTNRIHLAARAYMSARASRVAGSASSGTSTSTMYGTPSGASDQTSRGFPSPTYMTAWRPDGVWMRAPRRTGLYRSGWSRGIKRIITFSARSISRDLFEERTSSSAAKSRTW